MTPTFASFQGSSPRIGSRLPSSSTTSASAGSFAPALQLFLQAPLFGHFALTADAGHDAPKQVVRDGHLIVQVPADGRVAVCVVDGEVEHPLLHLSGELAVFGQPQHSVERVK